MCSALHPRVARSFKRISSTPLASTASRVRVVSMSQLSRGSFAELLEEFDE